jgi:hypothetical protein
MVGSCKAHTIRPSDIMYTETLCEGVAVGDPVLVTLCSVFPSLCVPSVSAGNLATSPVPGTVSQRHYVRCTSTQQQCEAGHTHNQHVITHLNDAIYLLPFSKEKQMALKLRWNSSCPHSCQPVSATNTLDANSQAQEHKCNHACHIALEAFVLKHFVSWQHKVSTPRNGTLVGQACPTVQ